MKYTYPNIFCTLNLMNFIFPFQYKDANYIFTDFIKTKYSKKNFMK